MVWMISFILVLNPRSHCRCWDSLLAPSQDAYHGTLHELSHGRGQARDGKTLVFVQAEMSAETGAEEPESLIGLLEPTVRANPSCWRLQERFSTLSHTYYYLRWHVGLFILFPELVSKTMYHTHTEQTSFAHDQDLYHRLSQFRPPRPV